MNTNDELKGMVKTPVGRGRIVARMRVDGDGSRTFSPMEDTRYLVCLSRKDFDPDGWKRISPGNGPCVFREYGVDELLEMGQETRG